MSASLCINCEEIAIGYSKYCTNCVKQHGVEQDENWHRSIHWMGFDYDKSRKAEFAKDLELAQAKKNDIQEKQKRLDANKRSACISCDTLVKAGSECRKCRKARLRGGAKHIKQPEKVQA